MSETTFSRTSTPAKSLVGATSSAQFKRARIQNGTTGQYFFVFDLAAVPSDGNVTPKEVVYLAANASVEVGPAANGHDGEDYENGIVVCNSSTFTSGGQFFKTAGADDSFILIEYEQ